MVLRTGVEVGSGQSFELNSRIIPLCISKANNKVHSGELFICVLPSLDLAFCFFLFAMSSAHRTPPLRAPAVHVCLHQTLEGLTSLAKSQMHVITIVFPYM